MNSFVRRIAYGDRVSACVEWSHWFVFLNVFVTFLIALRYPLNFPTPSAGLGILYEAVSFLGHFWFLNFVLFLVCLFPLAFLIPHERAYRITAAGVMFLSQTLLLVDTQIFHTFSFHLNHQLVQIFADNSGYRSGMNFNFLLVVLPLLAGTEFLLWRYASYKSTKRKGSWIAQSLTALFVICFLATHMLHIWADYARYEPITDQEACLPLSYPMTAKKFLEQNAWLALPQAGESQARHGTLNYPLAALKVRPGSARNLNYVLITIRGWGHGDLAGELMPHTASLRSTALEFTQHYSTGPAQEDALFSLFYGISPQYRRAFLREEVTPVLIDEFQRQSYTISRFIADPSGKAADLQSAIFRGLRAEDRIFYPSDAEAGENAARAVADRWEPGARNLLLVSLEGGAGALDGAGRTPASDRSARRNLRAALRGADSAVRRILEAVRTAGGEQNTVIIITGAGGARNSRDLTYENLHVPLLILRPGQGPEQFSRLTCHADLAPTLLSGDLGAVNPPAEYSNGTSLLEKTGDPFIIAGDGQHVAVVEDSQITLFSPKGTYQVTDSRDGARTDETGVTMQTLIKVTRQLHKFYRK